MAHMERALENCEKRVLDIQARNMSDNLIFHNIPEERRENTMEVILSFMVEVMNISRDSFTTNRLDIDDPVGKTVWIKRCHRLGTKQPGTSKPRPILVSLLVGKEWILKHARNLGGTDFYVATQLPLEVAESKRKVSHIFKKAKQDGKKPRYVSRGDVVAIDKRQFSAPVAPPCQVTPAQILESKDQFHFR